MVSGVDIGRLRTELAYSAVRPRGVITVAGGCVAMIEGLPQPVGSTYDLIISTC